VINVNYGYIIIYSVWEEIKNRIEERLSSAKLSSPKKMVLDYRMEQALNKHKGCNEKYFINTLFVSIYFLNHRTKFSFGRIVHTVIPFDDIRKELGLYYCKHVLVGADPINPKTLEFFMKCNIPILEVYGMSECTGVHSVNLKSSSQYMPESCGKALNGVQTRISGWCRNHGPDEVKKIALMLWLCCFVIIGFNSW